MEKIKEAGRAAYELSGQYQGTKTSPEKDLLFYRGYRFAFSYYDEMYHVVWGPDGIKYKDANRSSCTTQEKFIEAIKDAMDLITEIGKPHMVEFLGTFDKFIVFKDSYFRAGDVVLTVGDAVELILFAASKPISRPEFEGYMYPFEIIKGELPPRGTEFFRFNYAVAEGQ